MAQLGELNIGQLCREHFGRDAALIGFGTHTGSVAAASNWDGDMQVMRVRPSVSESYERLCHQSGIGRFLLDLRGPPELQEALAGPLLERFIGVIYRPESELVSHYMDATLPRQFDSYVFFDETSALVPLAPEHGTRGVPETFPFAL
jgi:erythromycin esterase-like protein